MTSKIASSTAACALLALLGSAAQAEPARIFRLPPEPLDSALLRFAVQGGVSVGGFPTPGCAGDSRPVLGVFTPSGALQRLLPPGCSFRKVDPRAFQVVGLPRAAEPPHPSTPPAAPSRTPPSVSEVPELVVTAEKRPEPLRGSPYAVSALDDRTLDRLGAKSFSDVALQVAGVAETNLGPGRDKIFIRGLSDGAFTGRTQSTVGLYLDEVPITYNAPDPDLRLTDVERVEVLRGPQGTLYGAGSIGGIVRIVPRAPDPTRFSGAIGVEGEINARQDHAFGGEAMLNAPLLNGRAAVRAVAYVDDIPGYLDNPGLGLKNVNRSRRSGQRLAALVELPDDWRLQAGLARQSIASSDSQYVPGGGGLNRNTHILEPHDNDFYMMSATASRHGAAADLRLSAAYIDHNLSTRYDATGAFDLAPNAVAAFDDTQKVDLEVFELVATSTRESRLRWLVGAFGARSRETSDGRLDASLSGGASRSVFIREDRLTEAAAFGELTYDLTPQLTVTAGGRLFATKVETRAEDFELARVPLAPVRGSDADTGFAPKLRLSYAFAPDKVIYAQAQDGFRTGGSNVPAQADGAPGGPAVATYRPDRLRSFEVGGEAAMLHHRLTTRLAAYYADWRDVQTDQFRFSGLPVTLNIGDGRNIGVEMEAAWRPNSHWRLRVNGLVNDPELTRAEDAIARQDARLPGVAKRTAAFDAAYAWDVREGWRAELAIQAAYAGRSFLTFDRATTSTMGDYYKAQVAASLQSADWRLDAWIDNVTNSRGDTFAFGNPFSRMRARQTTPLAPRTFGLAMRRSF